MDRLLPKANLSIKVKISENLTQTATVSKMNAFWKNMSTHTHTQCKATYWYFFDPQRKKSFLIQ